MTVSNPPAAPILAYPNATQQTRETQMPENVRHDATRVAALSAHPVQSALQPPVAPQATPPNLDVFRQRVFNEWTHGLTVSGWQKWHTPFAQATEKVSQLTVEAGDIEAGMHVLDLASGSGEPAITVARAVGPTGHVVASDLGAGMLDIAREQAEAQGCKNISFETANMETLPFADSTFDRVTCRWGLMFVPDHVQALREIDRVLKPGGRVVIIGWGATTQPFFAGPLALKKHGLLPAPAPGAPTPFKFSQPGTLAAAMNAAGLKDVKEKAEQSAFDWPGDPESFFEWFYDIAAPFRGIFDALDPTTFNAVREDIYATVRPHSDADMLHLGAQVVVGVASSSKPA